MQLDVELVPISQDVISTSNSRNDLDRRLAGTDAVIAAAALENEWSNHLITDDPDFHETTAIQAIEQEGQPTPRMYELNVRDKY